MFFLLFRDLWDVYTFIDIIEAFNIVVGLIEIPHKQAQILGFDQEYEIILSWVLPTRGRLTALPEFFLPFFVEREVSGRMYNIQAGVIRCLLVLCLNWKRTCKAFE